MKFFLLPFVFFNPILCLAVQLGDANKKRSSTPDVLRTRSRGSSNSSHNDPSESFSLADTISQQSDQSPMVRNISVSFTDVRCVKLNRKLSALIKVSPCMYYLAPQLFSLWSIVTLLQQKYTLINNYLLSSFFMTQATGNALICAVNLCWQLLSS